MAGFGPETRGLKYPGLQNRGNPGTKGVIKSLKIVIFQCRKISICSTFYTQSCTERKKLIWRSVEPFYIIFILKRLHKGYLKIMFLIFSTWHAELNANFISFLSRRIPCFFFKKTNKWEKFLPLVSSNRLLLDFRLKKGALADLCDDGTHKKLNTCKDQNLN